MKYIIILLTLGLSGCVSTAPKFPDLPAEITQACPELREAAASEEMSKLLDTVVQNYGTYYECRVKVESIVEWHKQQKEIYNKAVK